MTENPASPPPEPAPWMQTWAESLAQVLGQIRGSAFPCAVLSEIPAELGAAAEGDLWIGCACAGGLRGEMSLRIPAASAALLAQIFMGEPPAPATEASAEHREAAIELLRQVAGLVTSMLKPRWGEVQLRLEPASGAPSWPASSTAWLRAGEDPAAAASLEVQVSAALVAGLRTEKTEAAQPAPAAVPEAPPPTAQESKVKLDLLMDVELGLTLRFGSRRLPLREVLDLNPGAVIDLDRQVQEPVDVLLDGRLVARGEVVVMDGNYGLRVTEVAPAAGV
jgi:flagellar motor switch protein FliN